MSRQPRDIAVTSPEVVDVQFALAGQRVPLDHADALWHALREYLPWFEEDEFAAVHPLAGLSPGEACWYLSRRSRLMLRLAAERSSAAMALTGASLRLGDAEVRVGSATVRSLQVMPVLYAKFVTYGDVSASPLDEAAFHDACRMELTALGMTPRLLCGKAQRAQTTAGLLSGFSLMLLDLNEEQNIEIQRRGLGGERKRGCGVFVPHKSMAAAGTLE